MTNSLPGYTSNDDSNVLRIFIIRHGQTDHNVQKILQGHKDTDLNQTGIDQSAKLGSFLKENNTVFDKVISSDLKRCRQTIENVLQHSGQEDISVEYYPELRERHMGVIEGMYLKDAEVYADKHGKGSFRDFGEPADEFLERLTGQIKESAHHGSLQGKKNMALISHGGSIRTILKWLKYEEQNAHKIIVFNTSVTVIDYIKDSNQFIVKSVGNTRHLGDGEFVVSDLRLR
ncbi:hypothetical protein Kpol_413p15 [Vanderwaltozyma polyspora DSM 70294]|uniref:Phosphoglycerate mutase-like protein n=1 Tax=Vanderwaltozyma polyspora (strain ATCC 22028 / DSM 70294 / BCRC 21397 / CBS 2163 / NBRC 10782 / NRRL Y-8283 / UCD 57-17) TaxID=436907 RepID=A7TRI0_VANPO|nr:uncharacterized protein Kpol_413p15 [Vanderwaltozyma polyspora DSM 70294]EDO15140.1 hypothetical protein Kpol_413p15 [Vanderwaltozyma polyspora DSM 70294]